MNPKEMKLQFALNADKRKTDIAGLYAGMAKFSPNGVVESFRVINRDDDVRDKNRNQLGLACFSSSGPFSQEGTSGFQQLTRWLSGHPDPASDFGSYFPADHRAEIEIRVSGEIDGIAQDVWRNAVTGEINQEGITRVDGREAGNV